MPTLIEKAREADEFEARLREFFRGTVWDEAELQHRMSAVREVLAILLRFTPDARERVVLGALDIAALLREGDKAELGIMKLAVEGVLKR
jgi:hypothetical protein